MSLFEFQDLSTSSPAKELLQPSRMKQHIAGTHRLGRSLGDLQETIQELEPDQSLQFATAGRWSMHQLLEYVLLKTGPCRVWMTTWTITEEPMRSLLDLINRGLILELTALLDYRIEKNKPEAFQLASNIISRIKLTKCHAKLLILQNEHWNVTVLGSSNFSMNPRIEAGVIFTDKDSAEFHKEWIEQVIAGKEVFRAH